MKILFLIPLVFISCTTTITKGSIVDSRYIATDFIRVKGIGKGEFPDGTKGEGTPLFQLPKLELDN